MIDPNFKSSLHLRNNVESQSIDVTPVLYLSNGTSYVLSTITLEPAGVAVISLNDALRSKGIVPYATLSGHLEVRYNYFYDAICAVINNVDVEHSLIFTSALRPKSQLMHSGASGPAMQSTEGLWWKEEPTVSAFVALSNITAQPIQATVLVSDQVAKILGTHTATVSPHGTKIVQLSELQSAQSQAGGLRISYNGPQDGLIANGHLEDSSSGYSATIPIRPAPPVSEKTEFHSFTELGLMTGAADPMLSFPAGTDFTPFSVVRNISSEPVRIRANFWWMQAGQAKSAQLSWISLSPYQSLSLNTHALLASAGLGEYNGSVNLVLDLQGKPHSLLMASGSVDRTKTYVFQVIPRAVQESAARSLSYWSTGNGDDTMITIWNPADEAQDFVFTLFFSHGHYDLPLHLEPRATRTFNVSEIIQNQIADKSGNLIPLSVHEGSARIAGVGGNSQQILVALDSGTYNVRKATCSYYCIDCDGNVYAFLNLNPYAVAKGGKVQNYLMSKWYDGNTYNENSGSSWASGNTSVATVATGLTTGVSAGTASMSAYTTGQQGGNYCAYDPFCTSDQGQDSGSGNGTVAPSISINKNLWFFGSGISAPTGFTLGATSATLTASGGSGTYTWSITAGGTKAALQGTTSGQNVTSVTINSTSYSTSANDVTVQLQFTPSGGSAATSTLNLSVDSPYKLLAGAITNAGVSGSTCTNPPAGTAGFQSKVNYTIVSFLGVTVTSMPINENFTGDADDYAGNNWPLFVAGATTATAGTFYDNICAINQTVPPSKAPQNPLTTVKIDHASQTWWAGSMTPAIGIEVQSDTLQRYQDHGLHLSIVSPVR